MFRRSVCLLAVTAAAVGAIAAAPAGAAADTTATPNHLDFGTVPVGTQSVTQIVTLTQSCGLLDLNCLNGVLPEVFSPLVSATSGFTQTNSCPLNLITSLLGLPNSCSIVVTFIPNVTGLLTGEVKTGPGGPTVSVSGSGGVPATAPIASHHHRKGKKCKRHKGHHSVFAAAKKCGKHK